MPPPIDITVFAEEHLREAERLRLEGAPEAAAAVLEVALEACARLTPDLPGGLCGRLAALYRTLGRYDDEVRLLEHYRESQRSEDARTRYDARLSKARTIAERKRPRDSGALSSVRASMQRPARTATRESHDTQPDDRPVRASGA